MPSICAANGQDLGGRGVNGETDEAAASPFSRLGAARVQTRIVEEQGCTPVASPSLKWRLRVGDRSSSVACAIESPGAALRQILAE